MSKENPDFSNAGVVPGIDFVKYAHAAPLHAAAQKDNLTRLRVLLNNDYPVHEMFMGLTPLHVAVIHGHSECVAALLEAGADPCTEGGGTITSKSPLALALANRDVDTLETLLRATEGYTANHEAALANQPDAVTREDASRAAGLDLTPLHLAAFFGNVEATAALLEVGADVEAKATNCMTPLFMTAYSTAKNVSAIRKALIEAGADVNTERADGMQLIYCVDEEFGAMLRAKGAFKEEPTQHSMCVQM
jgi:ankyrin repeat protein